MVLKVDWSYLCSDLLLRVAYRLFVSDDYTSLIAIGGVCTSWRAVWIQIRGELVQSQLSPQLVWVELSNQLRENCIDSESGVRTVWLMLTEGGEHIEDDEDEDDDDDDEDGVGDDDEDGDGVGDDDEDGDGVGDDDEDDDEDEDEDDDDDGDGDEDKDEDEDEDEDDEEVEYEDYEVSDDEGIRGFCELSGSEENATIHYMRVPAKQKLCFSFPEGWVLTMGANFEMNLFHLLSGNQIELPSWNTVARDEDEAIFPFYVARAVLTENPSKTSDFKIITTCGKWVTAVAGPFDTAWTVISGEDGEGFLDFTVYQGHVFAINSQREIWVFDFSGAEPLGKFLFHFDKFFMPVYLVESSGELLVVIRILDDCDPFPTTSFCVSRLDLIRGRWHRVKSLGNRSLFLGYNASFSVDASKVHGCKANCIYFTDDNENCWDIDLSGNPGIGTPEDWCEKGIGGGLDMGIYDLTDKTIKPHFLSRRYFGVRPPMWVVPSFH